MGEGEGGMIWENGIETCIISCMKRVASPGSMHDMDAWGWCTGTTQRDGARKEEGGGFGRIHVDIWQNQYNIVKLKNKIKFKNKQTNKNFNMSHTILLLYFA